MQPAPTATNRTAGARKITREDVASKISAFVYGNVLVMAALIALRPEDGAGLKGVLYVLGTGASTSSRRS